MSLSSKVMAERRSDVPKTRSSLAIAAAAGRGAGRHHRLANTARHFIFYFETLAKGYPTPGDGPQALVPPPPPSAPVVAAGEAAAARASERAARKGRGQKRRRARAPNPANPPKRLEPQQTPTL